MNIGEIEEEQAEAKPLRLITLRSGAIFREMLERT
jgi:hypothetical protein